mgnify:CR=1 FL=1
MLDLDAELEEYIGLHSEPEPEILQQLSRATHQKILRPRMLSGNLQGQFLKMLCRMNRVQRVLEIGTFTGYAAISMAMGMGEKGVLHTIDINDEIEDFTRNYIERSGLAGQIVFHIGDACEIIPGLDECFDLVFTGVGGARIHCRYARWYSIRCGREVSLWLTMCCGTVRSRKKIPAMRKHAGYWNLMSWCRPIPG